MRKTPKFKIQNETRETHTIHLTRNRQPQPHFQKKREAEQAEKENSSKESSEESSDLSEAEALEEGNMEAEGEGNLIHVNLNLNLVPAILI